MKESLLLLSFLFVQNVQAQPAQSLESIKTSIVKYLSSNLSGYQRHKITVDPLDARLKLPECKKPLKIFTHNDKIKLGRNSVGVSCKGEQSWNIFHTATIKAYEKVVVLSQAVQRGGIISNNQVKLESREISRLRNNYFTDKNQVINKEAKRTLRPGSIVTAKNIITPSLIKRGEKITIAASSPGFSIQMAGLAMKDGTKGQRIPVRNENSNRIIEGTVIQPGLVAVNF